MTSYGYDANGNLVRKFLNSGIVTNYTYNKAGLMTYMETKKGGNVYAYSDCKYLLNGLINRVNMQYDGNPSEQKIKYYSYDGIGRLTADNITNAAGFPVANTYEYDLRGNRVKKVSSPADEEKIKTINYEYDLNNQLLNESSHIYDEYHNTHSYSTTSYSYDDNGNMTSKQGTGTYSYDAFNRVTNYSSTSGTASYMYNANNLRASKTVNSEKTDFVWNGQNLVAESKGNITNAYTYDMTGVHIANQNGTVTSYLKDYHGNVIGKITKSGERVTTTDYDAFGNRWMGETPDPFGYCGEYLDSESGLIYLRNRYYDTTSGRFITQDPVKDGLNWYAYCGNNPILFIDPFGLGYIWIREAAEKIGYSVEWNDYEHTAHVIGTYKYYYDGDSRGSYIGDDDRLYVWDEDFYSDIMLTPEDRRNNITITIKDNFPYKNINIPLDNALFSIRSEAESKILFKAAWFISKVYHEEDWDIKREKPWNKTIGYGTYPGWGVSVYYHDMLMTPEELGNFTYGYIGAALGFSMDTLRTGSWIVAGLPTQPNDLMNEFTDWIYIEKGYGYY